MKHLFIIPAICLLLVGAGCPETQKTSTTTEPAEVATTKITEVESNTPAEEIPKLSTDSDEDGLTDLQETEVYKTDPLNPDTDGDGYLDGEEVANGYSPTKSARTTVTEEQPVNDGAAVSSVVIDKTAIVNCGSDTSCFEERFYSCLPATMTADAGFAAVSYEITGFSDEGCVITFVYSTNPNPEWVGQPMYCVIDNADDFETAIQGAIGLAFDEGVGCTGPLVDLVNK